MLSTGLSGETKSLVNVSYCFHTLLSFPLWNSLVSLSLKPSALPAPAPVCAGICLSGLALWDFPLHLPCSQPSPLIRTDWARPWPKPVVTFFLMRYNCCIALCSFGCTASWFSMCIYCKIIITVSVDNIPVVVFRTWLKVRVYLPIEIVRLSSSWKEIVNVFLNILREGDWDPGARKCLICRDYSPDLSFLRKITPEAYITE